MRGLGLGLGVGLSLSKGAGGPTGYTRSTMGGVAFTYNGAPVFDNIPATPLSVKS